MNKLIILLICFVLVSGCRTTKKVVESSVKTESAITTNQTVSSEQVKKVDNDMVVVKKTTTTTKKYYPPEAKVPEDTYVKQDEPKRGAVKEEITTIIEEKLVDKGKTEVAENKQEELKKTEGEKTETVTKQKEVKKPIIKAWMIFLGSIVVIAVLLYAFRKSPLIASILAFIKNIFSKK